MELVSEKQATKSPLPKSSFWPPVNLTEMIAVLWLVSWAVENPCGLSPASVCRITSTAILQDAFAMSPSFLVLSYLRSACRRALWGRFGATASGLTAISMPSGRQLHMISSL